MTRIYECRNCGVITELPEQVCVPHRLENMGVYCGDKGDTENMCAEAKKHLAFVCGTCGRPAEQAKMVCEPLVAG